jgi:hypothetical protein
MCNTLARLHINDPVRIVPLQADGTAVMDVRVGLAGMVEYSLSPFHRGINLKEAVRYAISAEPVDPLM